MKKVLIVATVVKTHIMAFHLPLLKMLKEKGYEVHVAAKNDYEDPKDCDIPFCDKFYDLQFERNPMSLDNINTYFQLKKIIEKNNYEYIHCNTPVGGALTRIASVETRRKGTKVIYTAHGFHFYKGAPWKNWLLFYPVEKVLSKYTDTLITINQEDYEKSKKLNAKENIYVPGVGIDLNRFVPQHEVEKNRLRKKYGINENDFILFYAAELTDRKNQIMLLKSMKKIEKINPQVKLFLAGQGENKKLYQEYINMNNIKNVSILGFRNDVDKLMQLSDVAVSSSKQEGLPVNIMEAMATSLPIIATNCRGNRDLVVNNKNGFVVEIDDEKDFTDKVLFLYKKSELRKKFGITSLEMIENYSVDNVIKDMNKILG